MYDPDDFETPSPSPASGREAGEAERLMALMLCMSLLSHADPEAPADQSGVATTLEPVVPGFLLTLAQAAAARAQEHRSDPEIGRLLLDQAAGWLDKAVERARTDTHVLHAAGNVMDDFAGLGVVEKAENAKVIEQACLYLTEAARIAPTQPDILNDLGRSLANRAAILGGPEKTALLQEAARRFDEASRCFDARNLRFRETGVLHPYYTQALVGAGAVRWVLADLSDDEKERRKLLREAYRQLQEANRERENQPPDQRLILGRTALDLAWLPGDPKARRKLFEEARSHFAAMAGMDPALDSEALQGSATVGLAALSHGAGREALLQRAEELFAEGAPRHPETSEPELIAAHAWLRLAAEASADQARDAALRAAEAARRGNRVQPGSGDYNLACALSRLGQMSEAAEAITAALAHDPEAGQQALFDPDLQPLWKVRPELRQAAAAGRLSAGSVPS